MKVSVITTTYNSAATIADTLKSVLAQNWTDLEHIVVDGNSADNTMEIVRSFEPAYGGRLRYISEPDKGLYDAMNKGIRMATGDVVGILNSDDFFTDADVLKSVAEAFLANDIECLYGDIHFVRANNLERCVRYYSGASFRRWQMRVGMSPPHPSIYCRREVFDRIGFYDQTFRVCADFDFMLRAFYLNTLRQMYVPVDMVTMRTGGLSSNSSRVTQEHIRIFRKHGMVSNRFIESLRYIFKIGQFMARRPRPRK